MSAPEWLEHAKPPSWLGRPLTGRPDGSGEADTVADFADVSNLGSEAFGTPGGDAFNGLGGAGTALSQLRQSTAEQTWVQVFEVTAAGAADIAMGNVAVLGPIVEKIPLVGAIGQFLTANTQPILDNQVLKRATGGKFTIADLVTGPIRVLAAIVDDATSGNTKAVARLKARAEMGNTSPVVAFLVSRLRRGGGGGGAP